MKIGSYKFLRQLGTGGMGEVHLAHDEDLNRYVAIKIIRPERLDRPNARQRFRREARLLASVNHPFVAQIFEVLEDPEGRQLLVMEYLNGETLRHHLARGPLTVTQTLSYAQELAEGLEAIHQAGLIHRDLKPENVMVTSNGHLKILDFGLAKARTPSDSETDLSQEGRIAGTAIAMSPEQIQGQPLDARSDIFSLGMLLYELMTGVHPFVSQTPESTMIRICRDRHTPAHKVRPEVPESLGRLIDRMLAKIPDSRTGSAHQLRTELDSLKLKSVAPEPLKAPEQQTTLGSSDAFEPVGASRLPKVRSLVGAMGALLLVVCLGLWILPTETTSPERLSLAVLAPANAQERADLDWYGISIARVLAAQLALSSDLHVLDPDWTFATYRELKTQPTDDPARLMEALHADALVMGSFLPVDADTGSIQLELRLRMLGSTSADWTSPGRLSPNDLWISLEEQSRTLREILQSDPVPPAQGRSLQKTLPESPQALRLYGQGLTSLYRLDGARAAQALEEASTLAPDASRVWYALFDAYRLQGRSSKALHAAQRGLALTDPNNTIDYLHAQANVREEEGDWETAVQLRRQLAELQPEDLASNLHLASALMESSDMSGALQVLDHFETTQYVSKDPRVSLLRARIFYHLADFDAQLEQAKRAEAQAAAIGAPGLLGEALILQAVSHLERSEFEAAKTLRQSAQEHFRTSQGALRSVRIRELLAFELDQQHRVAEAEELYREVVESYRQLGHGTGYSRALGNLGAMLGKQGRGAEASWFAKQSLSIEGTQDDVWQAALKLNQGNDIMKAGKLPPAEQAFSESLIIFRELGRTQFEAIALNNLGEIAFHQGDLIRAELFHQQTIKLRVVLGDPLAYNELWLARIAAVQGQWQEALSSFERIRADQRDAFLDLAIVNLWMNDSEKALRYLEEALKLPPDPLYQSLTSMLWSYKAEALLSAGQPMEHVVSANQKAHELALTLDDFLLAHRLRLFNARLRARQSSAGAEDAINDIAACQTEAEKLGFRLQALEAQLALGELQLHHNDERSILERFEAETSAGGLVSFSRRAAALLAAPAD